MNQRIFSGLTEAATISTLIVPTLVQAKIRIEDLQQRFKDITALGEVVGVVGNNFTVPPPEAKRHNFNCLGYERS